MLLFETTVENLVDLRRRMDAPPGLSEAHETLSIQNDEARRLSAPNVRRMPLPSRMGK